MSALMLALLATFLGVTHREATRLQLDAAASRAQFAADQLAEQLAQSNSLRIAEAERFIASTSLAPCFNEPSQETCARLSAAVATAPGGGPRYVELWTFDRRRVLTIGDDDGWERDPVPPEAVGIGPLRRHNGSLYTEFVLQVPPSNNTGGGGYIVVRRPVTATATRDLLNQLVGAGAAIKVGNQSGDVWTDLAIEVPAPGVALDQRGTGEYSDANRREYVGALSPIRATPWAVWIEFPKDMVLLESRELLQRLTLVAAAFLALASLAAWIVSGRITTRLTHLTEQAEAIAAGDYTRAVPTTRRDEIGRLTTASNEMARRIRSAHSELERRVAERTKDLAAANDELESFSYSVSHDLRAPLRHISGFAALLERSASARLDDTDRRYLKTIKDAAARMGQLIDDLLAFSRSGRAPLVKKHVKLQALVEEVQREIAASAPLRTIEWILHPLPDVEADPAMLRQVLVNLLANAVKYTSTRATARVELGVVDSGTGELTFFVRDNGVGFDMQYAHKLFGVFQRLHRADEFEGTGIGLANVRRIIHRHGGRVWAEGQLNTGATFYFTLPIP